MALFTSNDVITHLEKIESLPLLGLRHSHILLFQFLKFGMLDLIQIFPLELHSTKLRLIANHFIYALFDTDFKSKSSFGFAFFDEEVI